MDVGLAYYRKMTHKTLAEIATRLDTTRQTVSNWEQGKYEIPKKYYNALEEFSGIPVYLLIKQELSDLDKIKIEECVINSMLKESLRQDEFGNEVVDSGLDAMSTELMYKKEEAEEIQRIRDIMNCSGLKYEYNEEFLCEKSKNIDLYKRFSNLMSYKSRYFINIMLSVLESFYALECDTEENAIDEICSILSNMGGEREQNEVQLIRMETELARFKKKNDL